MSTRWRVFLIAFSVPLLAGLSWSSSAPPDSPLELFARRTLQDAHATGFIHVREISSGKILAHVSNLENIGSEVQLNVDSPVAPLSVIKVYIAAIWLQHGFGGTSVDCTPSSGKPVRHMLFEEVLTSGCDSAGGAMAALLRRKLGSAEVLRELRDFGLEGLTLRSDASDDEWRRVLSLGEEKVPATPNQVSAFFAAIGQGGGKLVSPETADALLKGLEAVLQRGTASGIKDALNNTGWRLGGKTGTGPGECGDHCDGWFASLLSDSHGPRYVILVFMQRRGLGGGLPAQTAASVAKFLI
jgi:hypothetical protein